MKCVGYVCLTTKTKTADNITVYTSSNTVVSMDKTIAITILCILSGSWSNLQVTNPENHGGHSELLSDSGHNREITGKGYDFIIFQAVSNDILSYVSRFHALRCEWPPVKMGSH